MKNLRAINVRRINGECGGNRSAFPNRVTSLLQVNHYVMSKESYMLKEHYKFNEESDEWKSKTFSARANVNRG